MASRPFLLVTNDDGIGSPFLAALVRGLTGTFDLAVAAPKTEQSWIGKALTRRRPVAVAPFNNFEVPAWEVDGTPTDSVNIALTHLLDRRPDAVVSGVNIGMNAGLPFILASGTVAGALEGAFNGLPAFSLSQSLPRAYYTALHRGNSPDREIEATLEAGLAHARNLILKILDTPDADPPFHVHNINFPHPCGPDTAVHRTIPAPVLIGPLFKASGDGSYSFEFSAGQEQSCPDLTDRRCLERGAVSHTILDYAALAVCRT